MQYSQEQLKTMVYEKFGGQTECIMGNSKIENCSSLLFLTRGMEQRGEQTELQLRSKFALATRRIMKQANSELLTEVSKLN